MSSARLKSLAVPGTSGGESIMATVNVRYMVHDVEAAIAFYTAHFGFKVLSSAATAFADIVRGDLRLLLSGPTSSAGRPMPDGRRPGPGGWNRIHLLVDDLPVEVARLRAAGLTFRSDIVRGPGGSQIVLDDPAGNPLELFQPKVRRRTRYDDDPGDPALGEAHAGQSPDVPGTDRAAGRAHEEERHGTGIPA